MNGESGSKGSAPFFSNLSASTHAPMTHLVTHVTSSAVVGTINLYGTCGTCELKFHHYLGNRALPNSHVVHLFLVFRLLHILLTYDPKVTICSLDISDKHMMVKLSRLDVVNCFFSKRISVK